MIWLMTSVTMLQIRDCVSELLYAICKENVSDLVAYVGYGHAAGFLMNSGMLGSVPPSQPVASEHSKDTSQLNEEINPITGEYRRENDGRSKELDNMSEEEREREAEKLMVLINRLEKTGVIQTPSVVYAVSLRLLRRFPESVLMRMFPEGIPPSAVLSLAELDAVMSMLLIRPRLLQWAQNLLSARGRDAHEGDADESAAKTTHYYSCSDHAGHDGHANPQQKSAHHEGQAPCAIADVSCVDTSLGDMDGPSFASVHMDAIPLAVNTAATTDTISTVHTAHIPPYGPNISIGSLSSDPSSFYSESTDASDDYTETLKHKHNHHHHHDYTNTNGTTNPDATSNDNANYWPTDDPVWNLLDQILVYLNLEDLFGCCVPHTQVDSNSSTPASMALDTAAEIKKDKPLILGVDIDLLFYFSSYFGASDVPGRSMEYHELEISPISAMTTLQLQDQPKTRDTLNNRESICSPVQSIRIQQNIRYAEFDPQQLCAVIHEQLEIYVIITGVECEKLPMTEPPLCDVDVLDKVASTPLDRSSIRADCISRIVNENRGVAVGFPVAFRRRQPYRTAILDALGVSYDDPLQYSIPASGSKESRSSGMNARPSKVMDNWDYRYVDADGSQIHSYVMFPINDLSAHVATTSVSDAEIVQSEDVGSALAQSTDSSATGSDVDGVIRQVKQSHPIRSREEPRGKSEAGARSMIESMIDERHSVNVSWWEQQTMHVERHIDDVTLDKNANSPNDAQSQDKSPRSSLGRLDRLRRSGGPNLTSQTRLQAQSLDRKCSEGSVESNANTYTHAGTDRDSQATRYRERRSSVPATFPRRPHSSSHISRILQDMAWWRKPPGPLLRKPENNANRNDLGSAHGRGSLTSSGIANAASWRRNSDVNNISNGSSTQSNDCSGIDVQVVVKVWLRCTWSIEFCNKLEE
ncbi:hypothetical protein BASA50_009799 [Batrachochytrium salamandrivorans]|uniref:Uncharacterized protein n=1 Tax=Batrachochytrium salamandrivorans TaxID=1357716 RepID=A0ABQ8F0U5_9FUNG|nr:hypothetical protein BASA50_009799 [Batrachochytrium salamandrivorans]